MKLCQLETKNGPIDIETVETIAAHCITDEGPAPQQSDPGEVDAGTTSGVNLPDPCVDIRDEVEKVFQEVVGSEHGPVTSNKKTTTYNSMTYP